MRQSASSSSARLRRILAAPCGPCCATSRSRNARSAFCSFVVEQLRRRLHREHRGQVIQQLAGEALQLEQVEDVLFVHVGIVAGPIGRYHRAFLPSSLRNSMRVGLQVTVDLFPARTRG